MPLINTGFMIMGLAICTVLLGYFSKIFTIGNQSLDDTIIGYINRPLIGAVILFIGYIVVGHIWYYMSVAGLPDKVKEHLGEDMGMIGLRFQLPMFWGGWLFYVSIIISIIIGLVYPL